MWVGCHLSKAGRGGMLCLDGGGDLREGHGCVPALDFGGWKRFVLQWGLFWFTAYVRILYIIDRQWASGAWLGGRLHCCDG